MFAMFVKEMQQFFRSLALKVSGLLIIGSWLMVYFISQLELSDIDKLEALAKTDPTEFTLVCSSAVGYLLAIVLMNFVALIAVIGSSSGRWRLELGDPAFAPGITTCSPPWKLALGKWSALMLQVLLILLLCGILPVLSCIDADVLARLAEDRRWSAAEAIVYVSKLPIVAICMAVVWSSATLALCSLKPRNRSKVDIGMIAAMLWVAPQAFGLLFGSGADNWLVNMLIRAGVLVVGSLALITAGVSAPGANRLFFFKLWITVSVLVIMPLVWKWQGVFDRTYWISVLETSAGFFLLSSLFERFIQSRRVLTQLSNPLLALITFPFTTGVLNSMVLAAGFVAASYFIAPASCTPENLAGLLIFAAMVSLCNMAGFFFECQGRKFIRFVAFLILLSLMLVSLAFAKANGVEISLNGCGGKFMVIPAILIVGLNIPLIINYNSRKKGL